MKPIYPRIRFSPLIPAARRSLSNTVNVRPKLKKPEPEARFPVEGVTYQFNDEAQPPKKRLMGFREWCEKVYEPSKAASTRPGTVR
jgi:hypothetical protein